MRVGLNLPWLQCGHDFGPSPYRRGEPWRARDWSALERELHGLRALGVSVVRWWILAGCVAYPTAEPIGMYAAPACEPKGRSWLRTPYPGLQLLPGVRPPALADSVLEDLRGLCRSCHAAGVQLLPSLVSFEAFQPLLGDPRGISRRGREGLVFGDLVGFLDGTLSRLLAATADFRDDILAWEVVNEPCWTVRGGPRQLDLPSYGLRPSPQRIEPLAMSELLLMGCERIRDAGFVATVGFADSAASWLPETTRARLGGWGREGSYLHQHHHFPTLFGPARLAEHRNSAIEPCILGEMPTAMGSGPINSRFRDPEIRDTERNPHAYLEGRLGLARERGYSLALLWSARGTDGRSCFGEEQRRQVARFTGATRGLV